MSPLSAEQLEAHLAKQRAEMQNIVSGKGPKSRREMANVEHRAQKKLYQDLIPTAITRFPDLSTFLGAVYAIPVFNANYGDEALQRKAQITGARLKAEGMKAGSPDNHVPVPKYIAGRVYGSLYLELKAKSYPNDAQKARFPLLAACGNAIVTIRNESETQLAETALETILDYLKGHMDFHQYGHPNYTFIHNTTLPLAEHLP